MWVSVYINPQNNLAQAERQRKTKARVCFLSSYFFPRLLPMHGECQWAGESPERRSKCNPETVAVISGGVPTGLIRAFLAAGGDGSSRRTALGVMSLFIIPRLVSAKGSVPLAFIAATRWLTSWLSAHGAAVRVEVCFSPVRVAHASSSAFHWKIPLTRGMALWIYAAAGSW